MTRQGYVYGLLDAREARTITNVRYVGKTEQMLESRLWRHIRCAKTGVHTHKYDWMRSVLASGSSVAILELAYADSTQELALLEIDWITRLRALGCRLTNHTVGGDGGDTVSGRTYGEATRARIRALHAAGVYDAHYAALRGRVVTTETRAKLSAALVDRETPWVIGKSQSAEHKAKRVASRRATMRARTRALALSFANDSEFEDDVCSTL